ncbi:MAG: NADH-quinone oxidoreductase subunit H [Verrucomicrobiales bacterium]|jgi:NADH-quinone oxidoreductase subunit H
MFAAIDLFFLVSTLMKIIFFVMIVIMTLVAYTVYAERRFSAIIQDRVGPNRVGIPFTNISLAGLGQPIADGLKFLLKEDFTPKHVNTFYYWLAPALTMVPALMSAAVVPFGSEMAISFGDEVYKIPLVIADINVGPVFVFAITSLSVYGIVIAGWASNSKYPFFGGVRSSSQMISYEICMGLSIIPVIMILGELNLSNIVESQSANGWMLFPAWGDGLSLRSWILLIPVIVSFVIFTISIFAETNRLPFDLPECETELVAGYHTEYSSMKFALFFLGEYAAMIIGSGVIVTLFLGGWSLPFGLSEQLLANEGGLWGIITPLIHFGCFMSKVIAFLLFFIWVRWSIPRFRYDQLMRLGWVFFFEIALANIVLTAIIMVVLR